MFKRLTLFMMTIFIISLATVLPCCSGTETSVSDEIGKLIKIDVYVNDIKVETPVYKNETYAPIAGPHNVSDYVLLEPICESIGAFYTLNDDSITITYKNEDYFISEISGLDTNNYWIIDDIIYIEFSAIRVATNGSLKQDDYKSMYLYTRDFERLDIPATLEECYKALDEELDSKSKNAIKNSSIDDLIQYHFSLGMWIRNNWIYPSDNRIAKVFRDAGFGHPDDISYEIVLAYHYYLNNIDYEINPK